MSNKIYDLGLEQIKRFQKRSKPDVGTIYRKTIKNSTGTKRGQNYRIKLTIPRVPMEQLKNGSQLCEADGPNVSAVTKEVD
ncbi:unnamed protein product [Orchesella dallaii]|uniref:Uncharacterized protein n=1 Tax=Orchesella dallaii TaxID=48710 RepID=A0ABP1RPV2_9HEXA